MKSSDESIIAEQAATLLFESVGSRYAVKCREAIGSGSIPELRIDAYSDARAFALDYACSSYLKKYAGDSDKESLEAKAIIGFEETENQCKRSNDRLRAASTLPGSVQFCISAAGRKVKQILGEFSLNEFADACDWGPGATASITAQDATLDNKILEPSITVTRRARIYLDTIIRYDLHWSAARLGVYPDGPFSFTPNNYLILDASRYTTVEKDSKSRRGIDIQPTGNLFLQKGLGKLIRRRLQRFGVDLDDQSRNQWLASKAQLLGLSTIDLAKASDSLCYELVKALVPDDWFAVLRDLRASQTNINGECVALEKFSAMGNGYTFELESLIFFALISAVEERFGFLNSVHAVYGDDLIVENPIAGAVITLLSWAGFTTNVDKTFTEGLFYESCGKHYFNGVDVTPPYQKEEILDYPSACRAANRILRWATRVGAGLCLDLVAKPAWDYLVFSAKRFHHEMNIRRWDEDTRKIAKTGRGRRRPIIPFPYIPWWLQEDSGLSVPRHFRSDINGVIRFDRFTSVPIKRRGDGLALYANTLRKDVVVETPSYGYVSPRSNTMILRSEGKTYRPKGTTTPPKWL